ncbi:MAG: AraC family transcriptional regulator [Acidobacteriota bacterium]
MPEPPQTQIIAQARTADGIAFQLRKDPPGVLEVPELENVIISIHLGSHARLDCHRDGTRFSGTAVHGDIDIIPAFTPSRWEMHDDNDTALILSLPQKFLDTVATGSDLAPERVTIRNRFQIRDAELENLSWAMKREMEAGSPSGRFYLDGLGLAVASRLVACHSSIAPIGPLAAEGLTGRRLKQVLAFIEDNLASDLSLDQIASIARLSTSHVNTLFRKSMGLPLHRYVIQRRVERARALLSEDKLSTAQIALATGFAHQSHMARHLRRSLGLTPRAIKRMAVESFAAD